MRASSPKNQAYISIIKAVMDRHNLSELWMDEGFENKRQMQHFKFKQQMYTVLAVVRPNTSTGITVVAKNKYDQHAAITMHYDDTRTELLQRLCNDVYNWLRTGDEEDFFFLEKRVLASREKVNELKLF